MELMENIDAYCEKMRSEFMFFKTLPDEELRSFLSFCQNKMGNAGENLWSEGDSDSYAAFVISGKLGIKKKTEFEGKHMIVGTFSRGTVVGELCLLLENKQRSVTAAIIEPVDLVLLSNTDFERLMSEYPLIGLKLLKHIFMVISKRLNRSTDRIAKIF